LIGGCARYNAHPLDPADPVARYGSRRLDDPALRAALDSLHASVAPEGWRDWQLATAAWLLRPERPRALAEVGVARAGVVSAGAQPPIGVGSETEYSFSGAGPESRLGVALSTVFTVERGGRRGARIARAKAGVVLAAARIAEESRDVRWQVRDALREWTAASRLAQGGERELALLDSVVALTRARFEGGAASRSDVARADADRQEWAAELASRRREVAERQATLAMVVGVPTTELARHDILMDSVSTCPASAARDSLARMALVTRPEVARVLAEYQVAESEVRVEVAKSWPDLALGPGLFFDHGVSKWTIAFGLPELALHGNRGPIGEAEARREVVARRVAEVQEQVLGEVGSAIAGCVATGAEVAALDLSFAGRRAQLVDSAFARGETGRLEVALARLEAVRSERRVIEAGLRRLRAGLALERAMGVWSGAPPVVPEQGGM
jgi:outer membrane protein TolC